MVSLAGLSATYPGYLSAESTDLQNRLRKAQATEAETQLAGQQAFGNTIKMFQAQMPGAQPMPTAGAPVPQTPMPGQSSVPAQGQAAPAPQVPGAGAPPSPQMRQPAMPQPAPPGGGGQQGMMDWRQIAQAVSRANPSAKPEVIAAAVNQFLPLMNQQSQMEWRGVQLQLREEAINNRLEIARILERGRQQRSDEGRFGKTPQAAALRAYMEQHPDATAEDMAGFLKSMKPKTAGEQRTEEGEKRATGLVGQIDDAINDLEIAQAGGKSVAGITGAANRMVEWGGNLAGMKPGTQASDFQTKIRLIQMELPRAIAATSRISAAERAHLEEVVRGLGTFTSTEQALSALNYVRKILSRGGGSGNLTGPGKQVIGVETVRIPEGMSPQEAMKKYKSGTPVILPDGTRGVVP